MMTNGILYIIIGTYYYMHGYRTAGLHPGRTYSVFSWLFCKLVLLYGEMRVFRSNSK